MTKKGRPKKEVIKEKNNSIMGIIKKLIGTKERKSFWDWLTSK
tara:strand:- start:429 stop:557 length:129 start_codon:yes stop_codon:yes gene_type:complete